MPKLAYTLPHAAELVDVSVDTINRAIEDNELVVARLGRGKQRPAVRVEHEELLRWLKAKSA